nr:MAG TPA: hypothetical protein [Caudoviricetes sp.]
MASNHISLLFSLIFTSNCFCSFCHSSTCVNWRVSAVSFWCQREATNLKIDEWSLIASRNNKKTVFVRP